MLAIVGFSLFFLLLFVPTSYKEAKIVLLCVLMVGILAGGFRGSPFRFSPQVLILTLFYSVLGTFFVLYGIINGNAGAISLTTVYVLWPLVYVVVVSAMCQSHLFRIATQVLVLSSVAISVYAIYYLLYEYGVIPSAFYIALDLGQEAGFYDGYVEYNLYSVSTLLYLFPFITTCLVLARGNDGPVPMLWVLPAFGLTTMASILSGRRALWLIMALTPILIVVVLRLGGGQQLVRYSTRMAGYFVIAAIVLFGALAVAVDIKPASLVDNFIEGFQFDNSASANDRKEQFFALIGAWKDSPWLGYGFGAVAEGSIRSEDMPWSYELYFVSILFQVGVVGLAAYAFGVGWIFLYGAKVARDDELLRPYMVPSLVAMIAFLLASNTNPYLAKFDFLWVVFFPVAMINYHLLSKGVAR